MAFSDYSITPASNTSIGGINIGESCPAANVNNAIRQLMADAKTFANASTDTSTLMPKGGGIFTGAISYTGRGGYLHHNDSANTSGRVFVQASGGAAPSMSNGDILLEY